jgi:hypothetical protein
MWIDDLEAFARSNALTLRAARWLRCTAEHLKAKRDGGRDSRDNIVAACLLCNSRRHRGARIAPTPDAYCKRVRHRVARGHWHLPQVLRCGLISLQEVGSEP